MLRPLHICPIGYSRNLFLLYLNVFGLVRRDVVAQKKGSNSKFMVQWEKNSQSLGRSCNPSSRATIHTGGSNSRTLLAYLRLLEMIPSVVPH